MEVAQLQWLLNQVPEDNSEMIKAIELAIDSCRAEDNKSLCIFKTYRA